MKKILILMTLLSFVIAAPFAVAKEKSKKEPKVNCCVKGNCKQLTETRCSKEKGKVVALCSDCKVNCCIKGECKEMVKAECRKAKGKVVSNCDKCKPPKKRK